MKKFIFAAALFLVSLCFADNLSAGNFGVTGGANFCTPDLKAANTRTLVQWNAGISYKFNLPLGFQLHPAVIYNDKTASAGSAPIDLSVGYLEFMASVQWGVDLILFRPYLEVSPFVGYGVNSRGDVAAMFKSTDRMEYGVGLGGGLQIWRFQVDARYNFTFADFTGLNVESVKGADFNGVSLSLTYFFGNKKK